MYRSILVADLPGGIKLQSNEMTKAVVQMEAVSSLIIHKRSLMFYKE